MVSSPHEAMHRIFQEYPALFTSVAEALGVPFGTLVAVTPLPTDLTETRPLERRLDTLLRFETEEEGEFLLAVEAQSKRDPAKPASWAYYLSYLYNKYGQHPVLLVVCQDRATAEWASQPVHFGPPQWASLILRPLVAGPHNMPVITQETEARKDPLLATLAAITHADNPDVGAILKAVSSALGTLPEKLSIPLAELVSQGLGKRPVSEQWRNLMAVDTSFYTSWISEEIREEGREQGREEGHHRGLAQALLLVLEGRGIAVSEQQRERITACEDSEQLNQWTRRAITAESTAEVLGQDAPDEEPSSEEDRH
ncbi:hypothetical protein [Streptomyces sp. NPDC046887]|uniref:hypothetical protein n=1 Tax=Streptomyces sp. NPDC046887 TaxID=3155472 RepID=UPI0033D459C3